MFAYPLSPRYLEIDQLGVVFNMWYLGYLDEAMAAFFGALGRPYPELVAGGHDVMLVRTELDWSHPLRHGDAAQVLVSVESVGRTSFVLRFEIVVGEGATARTSCVARTVYVFVGRAGADGSGADGSGADDAGAGAEGSGKQPLPDDLRQGLLRHHR